MVDEGNLPEELSASEEERYAELQLRALDNARHGMVDELELMLDAGMPVNLQDEKGNSLLMLGAYNGRLEIVRLLIRKGAEIDRQNARGQTPLGGVAFKGYADIATALIEGGADVDADQGGGQKPLMFAEMFGRNAVADVLRGAGADSRARNRFGLRASQLRILGAPLRWILPKKLRCPVRE